MTPPAMAPVLGCWPAPELPTVLDCVVVWAGVTTGFSAQKLLGHSLQFMGTVNWQTSPFGQSFGQTGVTSAHFTQPEEPSRGSRSAKKAVSASVSSGASESGGGGWRPVHRQGSQSLLT